ncbi:MAG: hypothetical protein GX677_08820 [Treponema sp.]|nr:hypothetical protein [Treponema sp.]
MRKHKIYAILIIFIAGLVSGCKTLPQITNSVNPLDLMDNDSSFYISIPKSVDRLLIERVVQNNIRGISSKESEIVSSYLDKIYIGLNRTKDKTEIQSAIKCFLQNNVKRILSGKITENVILGDNKYQIYSNNSIDFAVLSNEILCLGRNLKDMIVSYDDIYTNGYSKDYKSKLNQNVYNYLDSSDDEIRFYANKPQSFLTILTGANLDLKLIEVSGSFVCDPKNQDQYLLSLDFLFKNEKYLKAGKSLLILAFGLTDSQSEIFNSNELLIKNIKINKKQLYKLLVI